MMQYWGLIRYSLFSRHRGSVNLYNVLIGVIVLNQTIAHTHNAVGVHGKYLLRA